MAELKPNVALVTESATLVVENRLAPGTYRFRLRVFDDAGNASAPDELTVRVVEPSVRLDDLRLGVRPLPIGPTPALDVERPRGGRSRRRRPG